MTNPAKIGITGGIGSGKSTVCRIFELLNVPVYYADDRGKHLLSNDASLIHKVKNYFGEKSYFSDGSLNRGYLAENVFSNPEQLKILNSIVHPAVAKDFKNWCNHYKKQAFVMKEAALIFETEAHLQLEGTIVVMTSKTIRMQRILMRDTQRTRSQIEEIIHQQVNDSVRKELGDYFIENNGDQLLIPQILKVHQKLIQRFN